MQQKIFFRFILLFAILFILTVPFPDKYIPDIGNYTHPFFEWYVKWSGKYIFKITHHYTSKLISDSTGLYIHVFNLVIFSAILLPVWIIIDRRNKYYERTIYWLIIIISYYLSLQLFEYGFSKIFKWQFYLPEPNTLFTTLGNTNRDLLYWSTMGLSRPYTIFAGTLEIIAACLLLFKRTRLAGALFAFFVLANIVAINFSYDISVKILSSFLFLLSIIIIAPHAKRLFSFFFSSKIINEINTTIHWSVTSKPIYVMIKICVIGYILFSTLSPYFIENNFNDDVAARPKFHGAYHVTNFVVNNDTMLLLQNTSTWNHVFVHRQGYFVTQNMKDEMQDYTLVTDTIDHFFILNKEDDKQQFKFHYSYFSDSTLHLYGSMDKDNLSVTLKPIDLKNLPALQNEFHWTIDNW